MKYSTGPGLFEHPVCIKNLFYIFFANFFKIKQKRANFSKIFISSVYPYSLSKF